jgi:UPF0176 protein
MKPPVHITAFYRFTPIEADKLANVQRELKEFGMAGSMRGLVLVAGEGINGTVCGTAEVITEWKEYIADRFGEMRWNDSTAEKHVFPRWLVKIKEEIVALKQPDVHPSDLHKHLSPQEWEEMLKQEDVVVLDARNMYETKVGVFKNAIDPKINHFSEFPDFVKKAGIPKDKKVMMYCTGGIRCEKALIEMEKQGYENVFQLKGGILGYLKEMPEQSFEGECFVFDHRVAVDQRLEPSKKYGICPHCGNPAEEVISCTDCSKQAMMCSGCIGASVPVTCSKDCRNRLEKRLKKGDLVHKN